MIIESPPQADQPAAKVSVRKRQDRASKTRANILAAARIEFASKGYGGATTRSIAERANIRHGLLVYHFDNKLGVWNLVMEQVIRRWHKELTEAVGEHPDDEAAALRAFLRRYVELIADDPAAPLLMSYEARDPTSHLPQELSEIATIDIRSFIELIRRAQRGKQFVDGDPAHLYILMVGAASRPFMLAGEVENQTGRSMFDRKFIEDHIRACEKLFFKTVA